MKITADPVCAAAQQGRRHVETFVSDNGGLGNVFVYVKDGLGNYVLDPPTTGQNSIRTAASYGPHVFGVRVGQPIVEFVNSDSTAAQRARAAKTNREFNFGQPIQRQKTRSSSPREVMVPFKCDVHGWMKACAACSIILLCGHDRRRQFELKNVPPGIYTIEAWHEKLGRRSR